MSGWTILVTALVTSLVTCSILAGWLQLWFRPRVMRELDEEFKERLEEASDVLSARIEEAVRRGVIEAVTRIGTREVIEGTTRNMAKTGADFVEEGIGRIFGRKPGRGDER